MTCQELLLIARKGRPNVRYAASRQGNAIRAWVESVGRFVMVASLTITNEWCSVPFEILVNGKPPFEATDWVE